MSTQKITLLHRLEENGWDVEVIGNDDAEVYALDWWADEAWKLTSVWSPRGLKVYLVFMVDPQADINRKPGENVWAVTASLTLPTQRFGQEGEIVFDLTAGWQDRLGRFIENVSALRNPAKVINSHVDY